MKQLPNPVVRYLGDLELALKQRVGVCPEDALCGAREHLCREYSALLDSTHNCTDELAFDNLVSSYGDVEAVANQYETAAKPNLLRLPGYAPGWRICCTRCGRSAPAAKVGITRVEATSAGKFVGGWCHDCGWFRWFHLIKDLDKITSTSHLGIKRTSEQLREKQHRPWTIVTAVCIGILLTFLVLRAASDTPESPQAIPAEQIFESLPSGWKLTQSTKVSGP